MSLTNVQYDEIQRIYSRRISQDRDDQQRRIEEAYARLPVLKEVEESLSDLSFARAKALLERRTDRVEEIGKQAAELRKKKSELLASAGFPEDQMALRYICPDCLDTGYAEGLPCHCRKKLTADLLYGQSRIREAVGRENFDSFSFDYYDKEKDTGTGMSAYDIMRKNVEICHHFIDAYDEEHGNLLLMGQTGTGKTFLSNCVAKEMMDRCRSVIYLSAPQLFDALARETFRRESDPSAESSEAIKTCDLLIIDDLGTELTNAFSASQLFTCINERLLNRKSTLISTNLTMNDLARTYTERVTSRLIGNYQILRFPEQDIRLLKRMRKG